MPDFTMYAPTRGIQDANPQLYYKAYEKIVQLTYPGVENMVGAQFWGTNELETRGLHNEVLMHTGLLGQAAELGDDLRAPVPMATFATADQIIAGYKIIGIGYEYAPDELGDNIYDIVAARVGELPLLLKDREEDEFLLPFNEGESWTSGWANTPLFVDGTTNFLQTIGQPGVNYGGNIIYGHPSYHLISLIEQFGDQFISEEGRLSPMGVDRIMASPQNARLLQMYWGSTTNIDQDNPNRPSPVMGGAPQIIPTHRMANPNDIIVFYEGWQQDLKERSKFRAQTMSEVIGHLNKKKTTTITRSRFSHYFFNNRRVLLVKGAAV